MKKKKILIAVIILVIVLLIIGVIMWKSNAPERFIKKYVNNVNDGDYDTLIEMTDFRGMIALAECDFYDADDFDYDEFDYEEFKEEYDNLDDDEVEELLNESGYDSKEDVLKDFWENCEDEETELKGEIKIEKLGKNTYYIKSKIKVGEYTDDIQIITYKNKAIYLND